MNFLPSTFFSNSTTELLLTTGAVGAVLYFLSRKRGQLKMIPGPRGIPIFGNALQLQANKPHLTVSDWAEEYGGIMRINLFGEDIVVVNSCEGITEMLVSKSSDFAGRPFFYRIHLWNDTTSVSFSDFDLKWSIMKKCAMKGLKQVGDQLTELEAIMVGIMDEVMTRLSSYKHEAVDIREDIAEFAYQVTFTLVYGHKLTDEEHRAFTDLINITNDKLSPNSQDFILEIIPWLRGPWYSRFREFQRIAVMVKAFREVQLAKTMERYQGNEIICAADSLIHEMRNPSSVNATPITYRNIQSAANDLVNAGVLTTSSLLYYFVALMASKPEIQEEAYMKIMDAIGCRPPTLKDRFSIPYIESMILEILRLMSHAPFGLPHKTTVDTSLLGFSIPKGTQVWTNLWHLHHDGKVWDEPWEFKPKRFLDDQGNLVTPDHQLRKQFFAFGAGRRGCAGEMLARNRTFLFMVTLLQKFKIIQPEGESIECDPREFTIGIALMKESFKVQLEVR